jgi:hypothetical protein
MITLKEWLVIELPFDVQFQVRIHIFNDYYERERL